MGSDYYMAPEIEIQGEYTLRADIYSLGVVMFICLTSFPPFQICDASDWWYCQILNSNFNLFWKSVKSRKKISVRFYTLLGFFLPN